MPVTGEVEGGEGGEAAQLGRQPLQLVVTQVEAGQPGEEAAAGRQAGQLVVGQVQRAQHVEVSQQLPNLSDTVVVDLQQP